LTDLWPTRHRTNDREIPSWQIPTLERKNKAVGRADRGGGISRGKKKDASARGEGAKSHRTGAGGGGEGGRRKGGSGYGKEKSTWEGVSWELRRSCEGREGKNQQDSVKAEADQRRLLLTSRLGRGRGDCKAFLNTTVKGL